jgi:hypothetical protein
MSWRGQWQVERPAMFAFLGRLLRRVGHVVRRAGKTWRKKSGQRQLPHALYEV